MAIKETTHPVADFVESLIDGPIPGGLVLYPDRIETDGDEVVAAYRPDSQPLRVAAAEFGIDVSLVLPDGAKKGIYTEHAADWVLPLIELPTAVVAALIASYLVGRLRGWRSARRNVELRWCGTARSTDPLMATPGCAKSKDRQRT